MLVQDFLLHVEKKLGWHFPSRSDSIHQSDRFHQTGGCRVGYEQKFHQLGAQDRQLIRSDDGLQDFVGLAIIQGLP